MAKILIADDEHSVRDSAARYLAAVGFDVVTAEDGGKALAQLKEGGAAVLFTDIRMPGVDGWQLAEAARELDPSVIVIYASGFETGPQRTVPGGLFLPKPYLLADVVQTLAGLGITPELPVAAPS